MTTYTFIDGDNAITGLTMIEAARELLSADSAEYEIRIDPRGGYRLWTRKQVANKPWTQTIIFSLEDSEAAAEEEIARLVIGSGAWETGNIHVLTDDEYAELQAELENE